MLMKPQVTIFDNNQLGPGVLPILTMRVDVKERRFESGGWKPQHHRAKPSSRKSGNKLMVE